MIFLLWLCYNQKKEMQSLKQEHLIFVKPVISDR